MSEQSEKIIINNETMGRAPSQKLLIRLINVLIFIESYDLAQELDKALIRYRHSGNSSIVTIPPELYNNLPKKLQKLMQQKLTKKQ